MDDTQRRNEIREIVLSLGVFNVTQKSLAERFNVSEEIIEKDMKEIIKEDLANKDILNFAFSTSIRNALRQLERMMIDKDLSADERQSAAKTISDIVKTHKEDMNKEEKKKQDVIKF